MSEKTKCRERNDDYSFGNYSNYNGNGNG